MSYVNGLEMAALAAQLPPCPHCDRKVKLLPMTGTAWGLEHFHEPECPVAIAEEQQPALERDVTNAPGPDEP